MTIRQRTAREKLQYLEVRGLRPYRRLSGNYYLINSLACYFDWAADYYPEVGLASANWLSGSIEKAPVTNLMS